MQFDNISQYLLNVDDPERVIYIWKNRSITVAEMRQKTFGAAGALARRFRPRDRVILALDDSPEWIAIFHGMILVGIIPVVIDSRINSSDQKALADRCQAAGTINEAASYSTEPASKYPVPVYQYQPQDEVACYSTSGTTSNAKLVMYSHQALCEVSHRMRYLEAEQGTLLCPARLSFVVGLIINVLSPWINRSTNILYHLPSSGLRTLHRFINHHKVTHLFTNPTILNILNKNTRAKFGDHLAHVFVSAEPLPRQVGLDFQDKFGIRLKNSFGATETLCSVFLNDDPELEVTDLGVPINDCQLKIVNDHGEICSPGTPGRLLIRSPALVLGYLGEPQLSSEVFQQGWYVTSDIVVEQNGVYRFVDRHGNYVKIRGYYTSSLDIENLIVKVPDVMECAVLFDQDDQGMLRSSAYVVKQNGSAIQSTDVRKQVGKMAHSAGHLVPDRVFFVTEIPKTLNFKKIKSAQRLQDYLCS